MEYNEQKTNSAARDIMKMAYLLGRMIGHSQVEIVSRAIQDSNPDTVDPITLSISLNLAMDLGIDDQHNEEDMKDMDEVYDKLKDDINRLVKEHRDTKET